jgi:hypothetical protein
MTRKDPIVIEIDWYQHVKFVEKVPSDLAMGYSIGLPSWDRLGLFLLNELENDVEKDRYDYS